MNRFPKLFGCLVVLVLAFAVAPVATAGSDCEADVSVSLASSEPDQEVMRYQFQVEISTSESCAEIHYDLILEIQIPNGQVKAVRKPRIVKLSDSAAEELVEHELPLDQTLLDQNVRLVKCMTCDLGE